MPDQSRPDARALSRTGWRSTARASGRWLALTTEAVRLDDAGFFAGDLLDGMAEKIFVVEIDRRDDGDFGHDDVGGVEAAAQANFVDREIDSLRSAKATKAMAVTHSKKVGCAASLPDAISDSIVGMNAWSRPRRSLRRKYFRRRCGCAR